MQFIKFLDCVGLCQLVPYDVSECNQSFQISIVEVNTYSLNDKTFDIIFSSLVTNV